MSMIEDIKRDRALGTAPKYGSWSWSGGRDDLMLSTNGGGRVYVMGFCRKGLNSAQPMFQIKGRGMVKAIDALTTYQVGDGTARGQAEADKDPSVYRMDISGVDHPDARRIARVPDMEAALLAAEELANALEAYNRGGAGPLTGWQDVEDALAAFRKATGAA
ncbi:hypothetical protein [Sulfitobacter sp. M23508]|uniref:hypothetical protein n=1 Tax=Sulfitobacter sp. M23508 TaxID=3368577 RepID=UPI0037471F0B